ncbi:hypothetical protein M3Y98_01030700 [Aphelenchoides besseyi]|nr:hypothetical protein M3Y98_01030700 [Aphelenchoides besseyi]KAI6209975.1 hypothetical protein M3Y96_00277900 [Aphelenchoides besseyi]
MSFLYYLFNSQATAIPDPIITPPIIAVKDQPSGRFSNIFHRRNIVPALICVGIGYGIYWYWTSEPKRVKVTEVKSHDVISTTPQLSESQTSLDVKTAMEKSNNQEVQTARE